MKKTTSVLMILLILVALFFFATNRFVLAEKNLSYQFLTAIYEVPDHKRYQAFMVDVENWHKSALPLPNNAGVFSMPEEFFNSYVTPFISLTTDSCLETVISNADHMRADKFAAENGWLFKVTKIALTQNYRDKSQMQYTYSVTINATADRGNASQAVVAEGKLVVVKGRDGTYKINAYKLFNPNVFSILLSA